MRLACPQRFARPEPGRARFLRPLCAGRQLALNGGGEVAELLGEVAGGLVAAPTAEVKYAVRPVAVGRALAAANPAELPAAPADFAQAWLRAYRDAAVMAPIGAACASRQ